MPGMRAKLRIFRYAIAAFLPTALLVALGGWLVKYEVDRDVIGGLRSSEEMAVRLAAARLERFLETPHRDVVYFSGVDGFRELIREETPERLSRVIRDAVVLSNTAQTYAEIRWIDENGLERFRIDRTEGAAIVVPQNRLQDKAVRYFFGDTMALKQGQVFVSPLDLNVDRGKVEIPYKPMIRFATPVVDDAGRRRGIVILNVLGETMLRDFVAPGMSTGRLMLFNADGYWLRGGEPDTEWAFMFGRPRTLGRQHPDVWAQVQGKAQGALKTDSGFWTWQTVYPMRDNQVSSTGAATAAGPSHGRIVGDQYSWKVVSQIPAPQIAALLSRSTRAMVSALAVVLAVFALIAWRLALARDAQARAREALELSAVTDALTSLSNRRGFIEQAERELARARRSDTPLAVLMLDLDYFKRVNDEFGHQAGDRVLVDFARIAKRCMRAEDLLGRYGGEEFCAVLPGASAGQAIAIAERIRLAVCERPLGGLPRATTISVGVAVCDPGASFVLDAAIARADEALYQAKNWGRNRVSALNLTQVKPAAPKPVKLLGDSLERKIA